MVFFRNSRWATPRRKSNVRMSAFLPIQVSRNRDSQLTLCKIHLYSTRYNNCFAFGSRFLQRERIWSYITCFDIPSIPRWFFQCQSLAKEHRNNRWHCRWRNCTGCRAFAADQAPFGSFEGLDTQLLSSQTVPLHLKRKVRGHWPGNLKDRLKKWTTSVGGDQKSSSANYFPRFCPCRMLPRNMECWVK